MAYSYISFTVNGVSKRYRVLQTLYEPGKERVRRMFTTVSGKTRIQDFGFSDQRWGLDLLVPYQDETVGGATYGGLSWLTDTVYPATTVTFTDHYGTQHTVMFEGELVPRPMGGVIDGSGRFVVQVRLRKHQP